MLNAATAARLGVNLLATVSTSKVVNDVIQNNVNVVTTFDAIRVWAGKIVLGMVAIDLVSANINEKWDAAAEKLSKKEVEVKITDKDTST
jgi:hypothetical protein